MIPSGLDVVPVTTLARFESLSDEWNACVTGSDANAVWLRHEWLSCWYGADPRRRPVRAVIVREGERAVGVAALTGGTLPCKRLSLPALKSAASGVTPRWAVSVERGRAEVYRTLAAWLSRKATVLHGRRIRSLVFDHVAYGTPEGAMWIQAWRSIGLPVYLEKGRQSPYLIVPDGVREYESLWHGFCSSHQRRILRQKLRRAEKSGVHIEHVTDPRRVAHIMETLCAVSARSWKAREKTDLAGLPASRAFYESFTPLAANRGWLSLWLLWEGRECIALQYDLEYDGVSTALRSDFDMSRCTMSPGLVLRWHALQDFVARGGREFDFGGNNYGYKRYWTDSLRPHARMIVPAPDPLSRLLIRVRNNPLAAKARGVFCPEAPGSDERRAGERLEPVGTT
jgi:hypothetical protein